MITALWLTKDAHVHETKQRSTYNVASRHAKEHTWGTVFCSEIGNRILWLICSLFSGFRKRTVYNLLHFQGKLAEHRT